MGQTSDKISSRVAERWWSEVSCRDDSRVVRRLHRPQVVDGVYRRDEGAWLDDFCPFRDQVGVMALLEHVHGVAIQRQMVPYGTTEHGRAYNRGDFQANPINAVVVGQRHGRDYGPGGKTVFTLLMSALAAVYRLPCEQETFGGQPMGWQRWRRCLLEQMRELVIVLAQGAYSISHLAAYSLLIGVKLKEVRLGIGPRQDILAKYRLISHMESLYIGISEQKFA